jgi:uncharacterized protein YdeI (YjbR/CyaY-like superfamily)
MERAGQPVLSFKSGLMFSEWLEGHHSAHPGIWVRFFKKASCKETITYPEALDTALCYGWIDAQLQPLDAESYLRKFTPRRPRSRWSRINTRHVERLMAEGKMKPSGIAAVEAAKADGLWARAYDSSSTAQPPDDLLLELDRYPKARVFFESLSRANRYAIFYRLQTSKKPETRKRRLEQILKMLRHGEAFH